MSMPQQLCQLLPMLLLLLSSGCAVLGSWSPLRPVERSMVFQPAAYPAGNWSPADLRFEDAWFQSDDGVNLHGWFVAHPQPRGVALFCHGNGGNVSTQAEMLRDLNQHHGLSVLAFDYRGYGRSEGCPSEPGILQDARAARRWLAGRTGTFESDIILIGQSLGGGVAIDLAANDGARALVLMNTFTSLPDVGASHAPWLLPHWNMTYRMNSLAKVDRYSGPLLISHGDQDEIIPIHQGHQLYEAATGPKRFLIEPGGRHNDPRSDAYPAALEEFLQFVDRTYPAGSALH
jgi:uncharacterized protein